MLLNIDYTVDCTVDCTIDHTLDYIMDILLTTLSATLSTTLLTVLLFLLKQNSCVCSLHCWLYYRTIICTYIYIYTYTHISIIIIIIISSMITSERRADGRLRAARPADCSRGLGGRGLNLGVAFFYTCKHIYIYIYMYILIHANIYIYIYIYTYILCLRCVLFVMYIVETSGSLSHVFFWGFGPTLFVIVSCASLLSYLWYGLNSCVCWLRPDNSSFCVEDTDKLEFIA